MPDRLPSLIVLVGFWIPPATAGWMAASFIRRKAVSARTGSVYAALAIAVVCYAAGWFLFNLDRMPPYIPGAAMDPTMASPRAIVGLSAVAGSLVLPGSALACALAFRRRARILDGSSILHR